MRQWFRGMRRFSRNLASKTQSPISSLKRRATTVCVSHGYLPLPDSTVAAAMLDRLLHRSVVFNINGDNYRMRAHRARAEHVRKGVVVGSGR